MRRLGISIAILASLASAGTASAATHCSDSPYRTNIRVHGMSCTHGKYLATKMLNLQESGVVTADTTKVVGGDQTISYYDGWTRTEFQPARSNADQVTIIRKGVWVKYDARP